MVATILPEITFEEALETTQIHSIAGLLNNSPPLAAVRPFRSPHHTISHAGLVGGGSIPQPGEISLAHNGVLFLDELPEFPRAIALRLLNPVKLFPGFLLESGKNALERQILDPP